MSNKPSSQRDNSGAACTSAAGRSRRTLTRIVAIGAVAALASSWVLRGPEATHPLFVVDPARQKGRAAEIVPSRAAPTGVRGTFNVARKYAAPEQWEKDAPREADGFIRGTVASFDGRILAGAEVCLLRQPGADVPLSCTTTDAFGAFQISCEDPATLVIASAEAHESQTRRVVDGDMREPMQFVLGDLRPTTVSGIVLDAAGGAVSGALVVGHHSSLPENVTSARSDAEGRFGLALEAGAAILTAHAEAYAPFRAEVVAPSKDVALLLGPESTLAGRVVDEMTEDPISGVSVSAHARSALHVLASKAITGADGSFRLTGLHAGEYDLVAVGASWGGGRAAVRVGVADTADGIVLRMQPAATLSGVIRAGGKACRGRVFLDGVASYQGAAGEHGQFSMSGISPGRYQVSVDCIGGRPEHDAIDIHAGQIYREWDLDRGTVLRGRVERANGQPRVSIVRLVPKPTAGGRAVPVDCTNEQAGEFVCQGLEAGEFDVILAGHEPILAASIAIQEAAGDLEPIVLRAPAAASILVRSPDAEFPLPSGFHVMARKRGGAPVIASPTREGHLLADLSLGSYSVYLGPTSHPPADAPIANLVEDGEFVRVSLVAPRSLEISGVVLDLSGTPLPDVWLHAESTESHFSEPMGTPALSNERGEFILKALIPGAYDIVSERGLDRALIAGVKAGTPDVLLRFGH